MEAKETPKLVRWPPHCPPPTQKGLELALLEEGWSPFRMVDPPCTYYHTQTLQKTEVRWVLDGQLLIGFEDREIVLQKGDRLEMPPGTPHWVQVLSDEGAVYFIASR